MCNHEGDLGEETEKHNTTMFRKMRRAVKKQEEGSWPDGRTGIVVLVSCQDPLLE